MKTFLHTLVLLPVFLLTFTGSPAQIKINRHYFFDMPEFAPGASHTITLSKLALKRNNYTALIKARLPNDSLFYTIPGQFPSGESFGYQLKVGQSKTQTDTLFLYYREGERSIKLEEVIVYFFHPGERIISQRPDRNFTRTVLKCYYDQRTRRGTFIPVGEKEIFPLSLPIAGLTTLSYSSKTE